MQKQYKKKWPLSQDEKHRIEIWLEEKKSFRRIWIKIWRNHTVISREVQRNSVRCPKTREYVYKAEEAENWRLERRYNANQKHVILLNNLALQSRLKALLIEKWRKRWPDEILWRLNHEWFQYVATSTFYNFVNNYKNSRKQYLRFGKHWYRKKWTWNKKTALVWVPLIDERPKSVEDRIEIWHWEVDMVVWPKWELWWLVTIVERSSRYCLIKKVPRATKAFVYSFMYSMLYDENVLSTTWDNWSEFAWLSLLWKKLNIDVFRCHPYASREKWTNERNNWLIRRFCPKWLSIQQYCDEYIQQVQDSLNHKPRKCLGYRTPHEVYHNVKIKYL